MFIGENLSEKEIAVLQAVADRGCGARFASVTGVKEEIDRSPSRFRCLHDQNGEISLDELNCFLGQLVQGGLIELRKIKGEDYVGLTEDGERCNLIEVF
jgi:hypothetical protein